MSDRVVVDFDGVGKMYRLYKSRLESFLDITSIGRMTPWWNPKIENFWALRNISFKLSAGSRLGIVGRNGAGKTTLLKLMTGNIMPTEGRVNVQGGVQALLEAGAGFHPEFSGYENVEASLIQNGLTTSEIKAAIDEIAEFTELGDFLKQPFKTYSAGMQARLSFTTATTVKPDILIIDEILGAGDAYFAAKSRSRMKDLVESGASILLVSHALDQIVQFCDEALWLERGRIVLRGTSLEVVKAYEEFVHALQDRQLKAANRQRRYGFRDAVEVGHFADNFVVALSLTGPIDARADINRVELRSEGVSEEILRIGDPQDSDQTHLCYVALNANNNWSDPKTEAGDNFRSVTRGSDGATRGLGEMVFRSHALDQDKQHSLRVRYRVVGQGIVTANVSHNGEAIIVDLPLLVQGGDWEEREIVLPLVRRFEGSPVAPTGELLHASGNNVDLNDGGDDQRAGNASNSISRPQLTDGNVEVVVEGARVVPRPDADADTGNRSAEKTGLNDHALDELSNAPVPSTELTNVVDAANGRMAIRRWPGEGSFLIDDVFLENAVGEERAVYRVGETLVVRLEYHATKTGTLPLIFSLVIYRADGIGVTQHVSPCEIQTVAAGEQRRACLEFPALDLADGRYVISVALHRELDPHRPGDTIRYDLLDRSYDFEVVGNPPLRTSLYALPAIWRL